MNVFTQDTWLGMAQKTRLRKDPRTSQYEVNTQPGEDKLIRIPARGPYIDTGSPLPHPAIHFAQQGQFLCLYDGSGNTEDLSAKGGSLELSFCFRWPGMRSANEDMQYELIYCFDSSRDQYAWRIVVKTVTSGWQVKALVADTVDTTGTLIEKWAHIDYDLDPDAWYWCELRAVPGSVLDFKLYEDGDDTEVASDTSASVCEGEDFSGTFQCYIGSIPARYPSSVTGLSVAYASIGGTNPDPWQATMASSNNDGSSSTAGDPYASFNAYDTKSTIFLGRQDDTEGDNLTWVLFPRHDLESFQHDATGTTALEPPYGKAIQMAAFSSILADWSLLDLLYTRTVFVLEVDLGEMSDESFHGNNREYLLRAPDDSFQVYWDDSEDEICVRWTPKNWIAGDPETGYQAIAETSGLSSTFSGALAIEVCPSTAGSTENIIIYEWDTGLSSWSDITNGSTETQGEGVQTPLSADWTISEPICSALRLYDCKVFTSMPDNWATSGDFDWPCVTSNFPKELVAWYSLYPGDGYAGGDNIKYLEFPECADRANKKFAVADRKTGTYRYRINPYVGYPAWDGCPYIENTFLSEVQDIVPDASGALKIATDAYAYNYYPSSSDSNSSTAVKMAPRTYSREQWNSVGAHDYTTGASPLQLIKENGNQIGFYTPIVRVKPAIEGADIEVESSLMWQGEIEENTQQTVMVTLYDTRNNIESNPHGPFRFQVQNTATETITFAFMLEVELESPQPLSELSVRVYRLLDTTGYYHLEGSSAINNAQVSGDNRLVYNTRFTCRLSDESLALQGTLEYDNDSPPEHICNTIWGGRAWFVEALNPSRVRFSKLSRLGDVPPANMLWTDEGRTGRILGFLPGFGGLLLLRERSIWQIPPFQDLSGAMIQPLIPDIGVVGPDAAVLANGVLYWASFNGIYSWDGQNQPVWLSERLDSAETAVWETAPRETVAYHDKQNHKVVFTCAGAAIAIDDRTTAMAQATLPDKCCQRVVTPEYAGSLYGTRGMVWKQLAGNRSLTCDINGEIGTPESITYDADLTWYYYTGTTTDSQRIGKKVSFIDNDSWGWHAANSSVGRLLSHFLWDEYRCNGMILEGFIPTGTSKAAWLTHILHSYTADDITMGTLFFWYESQPHYFGSKADAKHFQRLDIITGSKAEPVSTATTGTGSLWLFVESLIYDGSNTITNLDSADMAEERALVNPIRLRGNQLRYELRNDPLYDLPEIRQVRIHYRRLRPRGRLA